MISLTTLIKAIPAAMGAAAEIKQLIEEAIGTVHATPAQQADLRSRFDQMMAEEAEAGKRFDEKARKAAKRK